jgi:hypothetical protein
VDRPPVADLVKEELDMAEIRTGRVKVSTIAVPALLVVVIALAALSYAATRASITAGPIYVVPGAQNAGTSYSVKWRNGTDLAIIASFTPSRTVRVRSITVTGLDPKIAYLATSEYGFWDGQTPLPSFTHETDPLPVTLHPQPIRGAFSVPAHSTVVVRFVLRAIGDAQETDRIIGIRVDGESWSWAHTTFLRFPEPVRLVPPR